MNHARRKIRTWRCLFALLACMGSFGGHWILPQVWVWGSMLSEYARSNDWVQAAEDILSGKKPCTRCHRLQAAKATETKRLPFAACSYRADLALTVTHETSGALIDPGARLAISRKNASLVTVVFRPPVPPPRALLLSV